MPLKRTPPPCLRASVAQPEAEAVDQSGPGSGWKTVQPGLAQLHSFPGQTAPTTGPDRSASARGGYRERNRLFQTRRRSAAEKRRTRH